MAPSSLSSLNLGPVWSAGSWTWNERRKQVVMCLLLALPP